MRSRPSWRGTAPVKVLVGAGVLALILASIWWFKKGRGGGFNDDHGQKDDKTERKTLADYAEVKPASVNVYIKAPGTLELHPDKALRVHPAFPGVVTRVHKELGDQVRAGDTLASIDSNVGFQTYALTSPISGVVLSRNVSSGQSVTPAEELFAVGDMSVLRARLAVSARDLKSIKTGQDLLLVSENMDRTATKVRFISPILSQDSRTATAIADVSYQGFRPGMFVTGAFLMDVRQVERTIPADLCDPMTNRVTLSVSTADGAEQRQVQTGIADYDHCEVIHGLNVGEKVFLTKNVSAAQESHSDDE